MMVISHFNKIIRNKILWTAFASLVVISFVLWTTQTDSSRNDRESHAGTLNGKKVSRDEFQNAYFHARLAVMLMFGRQMPFNQRTDEALRSMAWRRLVSLRVAHDLKIPAPPEEVAGVIQQQPFFMVDGQFQAERYAQFIQVQLAELGATQQLFEEHMRQELLIHKVNMLLSQGIWSAPLELQNVFHQLYDTFVAGYAFLAEEDVKSAVNISEEQAQAYFEGHREEFTIPEQRRVKWVAFPCVAYMNTESLTEEALRGYYEDYIEEFTTRDTNDEWVTTPFEEVAADIRTNLAWKLAQDQAAEQAFAFESMLIPDKNNFAPTFEEAAHKAGLTVCTSAYFSVDANIPGLEKHAGFAKAAFDLRQTPDDYFSSALCDDDACYVLALHDFRDSHIPAYSEARADVMRVATARAVALKTEEWARWYYEHARAGLEKNMTFEQSLNGTGLETFVTPPFSIREGLDEMEFEHASDLVKEVLKYNAGEITDLIRVPGGYVFACLESRQPADQILFTSIQANLSQYIRKRRESWVVGDWQQYLMAMADFKDNAPQRAHVDAEPDEDEYNPGENEEY